ESGQVRGESANEVEAAQLEEPAPCSAGPRVPRARSTAQRVRSFESYALDRFRDQVGGRVAVDVGASAGGFTSALLERGSAPEGSFMLRDAPRVPGPTNPASRRRRPMNPARKTLGAALLNGSAAEQAKAAARRSRYNRITKRPWSGRAAVRDAILPSEPNAASAVQPGRGDSMDIGPLELLIVLGIALLLFGGTRLPKLARSMGQASKEFRKGVAEGASEPAATD